MTYLPHTHAHGSDPDTSHGAAAAVSDASEVKRRITAIYHTIGAATDETMLAEYFRLHGDRNSGARFGQANESPRKRRSDLTRAGVVVDSGRRERLVSGRLGVVWRLADVD